MKKNLNRINMVFVLLLLVIYAFVTYLFIDSNIEFVHFVIFSIAFAIIVVAYNTNILTGLVVSAVSVFGLGTYLFYTDYLTEANNDRYTFFWILVFPVAALLSGYFGGSISKISEKADFLEEEIKKLITKDEITGFDNIREFYIELDAKMSSAKRHKHELSLMLIEIGHYEDMVAVYGKAKMNDYIKLFSQLITNTVRIEDNRYKLYEDMFAVIMPHTNKLGAKSLEERIRDTFNVLNVHDSKNDKILKFGIHIAAVQYNEELKSSLDFRDLAIKAMSNAV